MVVFIGFMTIIVYVCIQLQEAAKKRKKGWIWRDIQCLFLTTLFNTIQPTFESFYFPHLYDLLHEIENCICGYYVLSISAAYVFSKSRKEKEKRNPNIPTVSGFFLLEQFKAITKVTSHEYDGIINSKL